MGSLLRTQNVLHVWNDFAWGVAKKMGYVADCIRILEDFSPESFNGSGVCMTNTIPQMTIPDTFDFFHKLGVFFPFFMEDFKDVEASSVSTSKATPVRIGTFFSPPGGTGYMTGLFAAHQNGWFGDRFLTHQAWLGLSHHLLGF